MTENTASVSILNENGGVKSLAEIENEVIAYVLVLCGGNMTEVAKRLGVGRSTIYRKVSEDRSRS